MLILKALLYSHWVILSDWFLQIGNGKLKCFPGRIFDSGRTENELT
jgi:hypothetical protein